MQGRGTPQGLADAAGHDAGWTIHTEVFDGPLDLLLYLVRRDGIDLAHLEITRIADAYLGYLDQMRELHLGVAGEYLVMAATLIYLKSLELLPRPPTVLDDDEEGEDPRAVLARRLADYQRYRDVVEELEQRPIKDRDVFARAPIEVDDDQRPVTTTLDAFGLLEIYYDLLSREAEAEPFHQVGGPTLDFETCCRRVLDILRSAGGRGFLADVLSGMRMRAERILSFVAVLEMARLRWIDVAQEEHLGSVRLQCRVDGEVDLSRLTGRLESE